MRADCGSYFVTMYIQTEATWKEKDERKKEKKTTKFKEKEKKEKINKKEERKLKQCSDTINKTNGK